MIHSFSVTFQLCDSACVKCGHFWDTNKAKYQVMTLWYATVPRCASLWRLLVSCQPGFSCQGSDLFLFSLLHIYSSLFIPTNSWEMSLSQIYINYVLKVPQFPQDPVKYLEDREDTLSYLTTIHESLTQCLRDHGCDCKWDRQIYCHEAADPPPKFTGKSDKLHILWLSFCL